MDAPFRLDLFDASTFPGRRDEAWKYSDFKRFVPAPPRVAPAVDIDVTGGPFRRIIVDGATFANGRAWDGSSNQMTIVGGTGAPQLLRWVTDAANSGWQASVGLTVRPGERMTLLESYEGRGEAYAANALLNIAIEPGARLDRVVIAEDAIDGVTVSTARVRLGEGARFNQIVIATGGRLQRIETQVDVVGENAEVGLNGVYLVGDGRHADLTSTINHDVPNGQTRQLIKGVARKGGRGVFQGKIVVERGAQKTDARQYHHGMLLEDGAEIFAKPELMIHADDVQCAHGNTAGGLDERALFYMRSRGVPEGEARALLIESFLVEAVPDGLPEELREELVGRIRAWLAGGAA